MAQAPDDLSSRQPLQMLTGLAQTNAVGLHFANLEILSHQMIERDATCHQVAPALAGSESHLVIAFEGLDRFGFDQRQFEVGLGLGESSLAQSVAVAFEAGTRNG